MCQNKRLFFAVWGLCGVICISTPVLAQSEMDLLLFEKKHEMSQNDSEIDLGVDVHNTLSENLAKKSSKNEDDDTNETNDISEDKPIIQKNESENWLKSLIMGSIKEPATEYAGDELSSEEKENIRQMLNQRKNAAMFDISGIKLRMAPEEVFNTLTAQGYKRIVQNMEIPNFIRWRSEELCRQHGVIGFERVNACATRVAEENGYNFVERETYNRYSTKESIDIYYTSNFTNNLSHRIFYKSSVPLSDSRASNNVYINNLKIYDFWKRIDLKYGPPDNTSEIKWGLGGKKPYLKAKTGYLELADPLLKDLDMSRMFSEDTRLANTNYYTF